MTVLKVANPDDGIKVVCNHIIGVLGKSVHTTMALSGGSTPRPLYKQLDQHLKANPFLMHKLNVCWVDERVVPYESERSNYGNTIKDWTTLKSIRHIPFPIHHEVEKIADAYEAQLRNAGMINGSYHTNNMSIIGMGADGHTASVFPGVPLQYANDRAAVCFHPEHNEWRATLTLDMLKRSRENIALVFGSDKLAALKSCVNKEGLYPFEELMQENMLLITDQDV